MWDRPTVDFITTQILPWEKLPPSALGGEETGVKKVLSRSEGRGAETSIVRVTSPIVGRVAAALDLYVLSGKATLNGRPLPASAFVHIPAGAQIRILVDIGPLIFYCGSFGPMELDAEDGPTDDLEIIDVDRQPWTDMGWRGDEAPNPAVKIKWLRDDSDIGIAFVVAMLPGWRSELEEKHPVYEESFKLHGDLLLGRRGVVAPGGYFFRPPESWHGPLYSRTGNMSLIRKSGFGSTDYRECEGGFTLDKLIERAYLNETAPSVWGC